MDTVTISAGAPTSDAGPADPPFGKYCNVTVFFAHCAYNVTVEHPIDDPGAYDTPDPSTAVFQPKNEYPSRTGTVDDTVTDPDVHD